MTRDELRNLGNKLPGSAALPVTYEGPWFQYAATGMCANARPGAPGADNNCGNDPCVRNADLALKGPAVKVWEREVDAAGQPMAGADWQDIGYTCLPSLVPGNQNALTMAMIVEQFHDTAFAKAEASVQPVKGTTLVNLPTFYGVQWPEAGFAPDEIDTTTLVGRQVQIRPTFKSANYVFGDGRETGPVASLGGPYPNGDVRHTYGAPADVQVRIDVTYGGQFSVGGGEWIDIPDVVSIQGTPFALRVAEARAQLVR